MAMSAEKTSFLYFLLIIKSNLQIRIVFNYFVYYKLFVALLFPETPSKDPIFTHTNIGCGAPYVPAASTGEPQKNFGSHFWSFGHLSSSFCVSFDRNRVDSTVVLDNMIAFCVLLILAMAFAAVPIYDPMFVFCGSGNSCYDILEIRRNATIKQIRRAYRRLSLEYHPDKSKHANATEAFRLISKAYEVLDGNETRKNFDYYLDHPRDYFKVSGHHYMRQLPKSDVRLVLLLVACIISAIMHVMQEQKHNNFLKHLKLTIADCANAKSNLQTQALFEKAVELYEKKSKADVNSSWATSSDTKKKTPKKMVQDPMFQECVDEVVSSLKIEGGYRKPDYNDLFIVRLVYFPLHFYQW